jgi:hypothetical protein
MARRRRSRGGGRGGLPTFGGGMIGSVLMGLGAAAVAKRFIGAPLGTYTGAAAGALASPNKLGGILGGWLHDNIGNVGGATGSNLPYAGGI